MTEQTLTSPADIPRQKRHEGKPWTKQEGEYAMALIAAFNEGTLESQAEGISLQDFLSAKLNCNAQRICQKFGMAEGCGYMNESYVRKPTLTPEEAFIKGRKLKKLKQSFEFALAAQEVEEMPLMTGPGPQTQREPSSWTAPMPGDDRIMELYHQQLLLERQVCAAIGGTQDSQCLPSFGLGSGLAHGRSLVGSGIDKGQPSQVVWEPAHKRQERKRTSTTSASQEGLDSTILTSLTGRQPNPSSQKSASSAANTANAQGNDWFSNSTVALTRFTTAIPGTTAPVQASIFPNLTWSQQYHHDRNSNTSDSITASKLQATRASATEHDDGNYPESTLPAAHVQCRNDDEEEFLDDLKGNFLRRKRELASVDALQPVPQPTTSSSSNLPTTNSKKPRIV